MQQFTNDSIQTFGAAETVEFQASPAFCYHQVDVGLGTAGTVAVHVDFGTGYKLFTTIDMTDNTEPVTIGGHVKKIKLVPADMSVGGFNVSYSAGVM